MTSVEVLESQKEIFSDVQRIGFGFYTSDEIRKLSVKEIKNEKAIDAYGNMLPDGLYDPAMGVSPYDRLSRCPTCGLDNIECPGHNGHIELPLPIYNLHVIGYMYNILRAKCYMCHRFKLPQKYRKQFKTMFLLLKLGFEEEYITYDIHRNQSSKKEGSTSHPGKPGKSRKGSSGSGTDPTLGRSEDEESSIGGKPEKNQKRNASLGRKDETKRIHILLKNIRKAKGETGDLKTKDAPTSFTLETLISLEKELFKMCKKYKTCPLCSAGQPVISKQGYIKFIMATNPKLSIETSKVLFSKKTVDDKSEAEEHSQSDSDDKKSGKKSKKAESDDEKIEVKTENEEEQAEESFEVKKEETSEDDESTKQGKKPRKGREKMKKEELLTPIEVREQMRTLWKNEKGLIGALLGKVKLRLADKSCPRGYVLRVPSVDSFFIEALAVAPNRFRPENKIGEQAFLHPQTNILRKIITLNGTISRALGVGVGDSEEIAKKTQEEQQKPDNIETKSLRRKDVIEKWVELQEMVNMLFDSTTDKKAPAAGGGTGIRQLLEKKEGLFRMKMMGKRVNFAARSVISPDPNLGTNEVGIPVTFAKKVTFSEWVNYTNYKQLQRAIIRGAHEYPGANQVEEGNKTYYLDVMPLQQRKLMANNLLHNMKNKRVKRHLLTGDVALFNRQPTLHKPSFMSHVIKVLPREQVIRFHYANCSGYNADFDGDEMNLHFVQNHLARVEAYSLSMADYGYIVPTSGKPIRGLIQDSVVAATFLSSKTVFLTKSEYTQLVYGALDTFLNNISTFTRLKLLPPAIRKPIQLWTGKQAVSDVLRAVASLASSVVPDSLGAGEGATPQANSGKGLNLKAPAKISEKSLDIHSKNESSVLIKDNEILTGLVDKNQVGATEFGMVHGFYEIYGAKLTGKLLTALTKLFVAYLQHHGFSCGLEDLVLNEDTEEERVKRIEKVLASGVQASVRFAKYHGDQEIPRGIDYFRREKALKTKKISLGSDYFPTGHSALEALKKRLLEEPSEAGYDNFIKAEISGKLSEVNSFCLGGLKRLFPENLFSVMTLTGAKGSQLNHSQISCMLGQQELEGRRVPRMPSGSTLPCFQPYDPNPRTSGFIGDRFLTGLRAQEFYFHCMAGREGLIDTAVKTARSGYLQRCLIKSLESLQIEYDFTVRADDGSIIQFFYGEDGLDPTCVKPLSKPGFLIDNMSTLMGRISESVLPSDKKVKKELKKRKKAKKDPLNPLQMKNTILSLYPPFNHLGSMSEKALKTMDDSLPEVKLAGLSRKEFSKLFAIKYFQGLANPGDAVGILAAQSFGEPSTQMTLNTFHLAGHSGVNFTLGVPRLKELLTSKRTSTPAMMLSFKDPNIKKAQARRYALKLERRDMMSLIREIQIQEELVMLDENSTPLPMASRCRAYSIKVFFESFRAIKECFEMGPEELKSKVLKEFVPLMDKTISKLLSKKTQASKLDLDTQVSKASKSLAKAAAAQEEEEEKDDEDTRTIFDPKIISQNQGVSNDSRLKFDNETESFCFCFKMPINSEKIILLEYFPFPFFN